MPITERQRAHVFQRPLLDTRPARFKPRLKNVPYLARQMMRPGRIGAQLQLDNSSTLALFTLFPSELGMPNLTASSLYSDTEMSELFARIAKCFSGTCYAVAEVGKGVAGTPGHLDARGGLHVHVIAHPTAYTPIFSGSFRRHSERHKSVWNLPGLLEYLQKPAEAFSLAAVNDYRAACVLSNSGRAPRTRRSFTGASRRAWSELNGTIAANDEKKASKRASKKEKFMPNPQTAKAELKKKQARLLEIQELQQNANAEVEALKTSSDLNALATAQSRATAASQLLSKAQQDVDQATNRREQSERAHEQSKRLSAATEHAAQSAEAREALDAALAKGSKALEAIISDAITAYDGVLKARTAYAALLEADAELQTELDRSGVRCAVTPDADRNANLQQFGPLAGIVWSATAAQLRARAEHDRAEHARTRARAREKVIAAARREREARTAEHLAELAAAQALRDGSDDARARRNNSSFSIPLGDK